MDKYNYAILKRNKTTENSINIKNVLEEQEILLNLLKENKIQTHTIRSLNFELNDIRINQYVIATRKFLIFCNFEDKITENRKPELSAHFGRFFPLNRIYYLNYDCVFSSENIININDIFYLSINENNELGGKIVAKILQNYGFKTILLKDCKEPIKKIINYLENNILMVKKGYENLSVFQNFDKIIIENNDNNLLDIIWINNKIIIANNNKESIEKITNLKKYKILIVKNNELKNNNIALGEILVLF